MNFMRKFAFVKFFEAFLRKFSPTKNSDYAVCRTFGVNQSNLLFLTGLLLHNHYPLLYQQAAFNFFTSLDPDPDDAYAPDHIYYVRSGYLGSQNVTWAHWTGDPSSDW